MAKKSTNGNYSKSGWHSGREADSTFSFILRISFDRSPGTGTSRPLFRLEDVAAGREWHFTEYASAEQSLALRVQDIINRPDPV